MADTCENLPPCDSCHKQPIYSVDISLSGGIVEDIFYSVSCVGRCISTVYFDSADKAADSWRRIVSRCGEAVAPRSSIHDAGASMVARALLSAYWRDPESGQVFIEALEALLHDKTES